MSEKASIKKEESKMAQIKSMLQDINYNLVKTQALLITMKDQSVGIVLETEARLFGISTAEPKDENKVAPAAVVDWERDMASLFDDVIFVANNARALKATAEIMDEIIFKETNELKSKLIF